MLLDFASLMARSQDEGWSLVALDLGVDTSTPAGEFMASVMASAAQWERRIIGQRSRDALAAKRAQGVQLGRRPSISLEVAAKIHALRAQGSQCAPSPTASRPKRYPQSAVRTGGPRPRCSECFRQHEDICKLEALPCVSPRSIGSFTYAYC